MWDFPTNPTLDQTVTFPEGPTTYVCIDTTPGAAIWDKAAATTTPPPPLTRPTIATVTPVVKGLNDPDLVITVTGTEFVATSRVFAGVNPLATTFVSATQLTAVFPAAATGGTYAITVNNDGLASMPPLEFTVIPNPTINTSLTPTSGAAGAVFTVWGDHFDDDPNWPTTIYFDNVAQATTYGGSDRATVTAPVTAGVIQLQVQNGPILAGSAPVPFTVT